MLHRCEFKVRKGYRAIFSCDKIVRKQQKCISYIEENHDQVVDYFLNALRFCRIKESISLADVVIDRSFVERVDAMASDYWFCGDTLDTKNLELRVSLIELQTSFRFRGAKCVDLFRMRHLCQQMELGDAFLGSLAQDGVWNVNFGYRRNSVADAAIVKFAFGDHPGSADDRELTIWKASAFPQPPSESLEAASKFVDKLVKARRESRASHQLRMTIICEDFAHPALFTQEQTNRRGVARVVFDDIPNFGVALLPPRYIAGVAVRELRLWSNVPEPEVVRDEEDDSDDEEEEDSDLEDDYDSGDDSDLDDGF